MFFRYEYLYLFTIDLSYMIHMAQSFVELLAFRLLAFMLLPFRLPIVASECLGLHKIIDHLIMLLHLNCCLIKSQWKRH